jgi:tripartite-type tricarboxylate transporter receptor subunit TctC
VRRELAILFALAASALAVPCVAQSDYPNRPVRLVVQYPPGGSPDLVARVLATKLGESLGQQVVVENRAGANGNIATDLVAKAAPDGYTLLLASDGPIVINPSLYAKLPFDPLADLAPVTLATAAAFLLLAAPDFPAASVVELVKLARAQPGRYNFASSGNGSQHHLAGELLNTLGGIKLVHVPYRGFGPAVADVMGGKVELVFGSVPAAVGHVKGGKLKALGITSARRYAGLPETPTLIEAGLAGFEINAWFGVMAPAGVPRPIVERVHAEAVKALRAPDVAARFDAQGMDVIAAGPDAFAARIRADTRLWANVVKQSGAKLE